VGITCSFLGPQMATKGAVLHSPKLQRNPMPKPIRAKTMIARAFFFVLVLLGLVGCRAEVKGSVRTLELVSKPMKVDGVYTSMVGPSEERQVTLEEGKRELLWLVGYEAHLVSRQSGSLVPDRFMCHVSVDLEKKSYQQVLGPRLDAEYRLVTLTQGMTQVDFPAGFGMPIPSNQLLWVRSQILNLNEEELSDQVQFEIKLRYIRDADLESPLKPLFLVRAPVVKSVDPDQNHFGGVQSEAGCSVGVNANPDGYLEYDSQGQAFIPHWKVPPGREETKTLITERLSLPEDMRVHCIVTHVHPAAESLTLVDLTTMEAVYQARTEPAKDLLALESISTYSSQDGLLLQKDHQYGLISIYDNQTDKELDSMAVMYLYIHDPKYLPPSAAEFSTPLPPETEMVKREPDKVEWRSASPLPLVNAFLGSVDGWKLVESSENWSEWKGPTGRLRVEQTGSRSTISLIAP
jgi:hypothetical protein